MKHLIFLSLLGAFLLLAACKRNSSNTSKDLKDTLANRVKPLVTLPPEYITCDGMANVPNSNDVIMSVPNFSNDTLLKEGKIKKASPAFMAILTPDDKIRHWYDFKPGDLNPATGKVGPMDCAFGPDGNLYINDRQYFFNKKHNSRIIRINVKNGQPVSMEVVVEKLLSCNGMYWKGNTLFVTESVLQLTDTGTVSGVYAYRLQELNGKKPVQMKAYANNQGDPHLVVKFTSNKPMKSGADGIVCDDQGNLYTTVIEEGAVYKTVLDSNNKPVKTTLFAKNKAMDGTDGIIFDARRRCFYQVDFTGNAIHRIDMQGQVVTLQRNGDEDGKNGLLDQPAEVVLRGNELIIVNMDMAWATPGLSVNKTVNLQHYLSKIDLP
ncbi:SMP-30/gluconolactonase/LRE family protein [Mucilaginibacter jinjuensis]|uniref:SMP-30/gluconolactonase/LRE family protein n=1 Tax=Mucilaginibacter jinjuensis TaxID=1176721 RepID=A0ABY7TDQ0_9SPHI|nr:SMP-30/gluconolactonase/LRE family protein [Mucilaginibacter jinjuensis]WCT14323.1 SMP-30/gluconolactonase/LRE family protein [Mucilaginibacter jinjuensis]